MKQLMGTNQGDKQEETKTIFNWLHALLNHHYFHQKFCFIVFIKT